jgi:hypothetical protein
MAEGHSAKFRRLKLWQIILSAITSARCRGRVLREDVPAGRRDHPGHLRRHADPQQRRQGPDPGAGKAQKHRETASDVWKVREACLSLLTDIRDPALPITDLRKRRDDLQAQLYKIYRAAPHTDGEAYGKAQDALKKNEELTFSELEIDVTLPAALI